MFENLLNVMLGFYIAIFATQIAFNLFAGGILSKQDKKRTYKKTQAYSLDIIFYCRNQRKYAVDSLERLVSILPKKSRLIVIDNNSKDGSTKEIYKYLGNTEVSHDFFRGWKTRSRTEAIKHVIGRSQLKSEFTLILDAHHQFNSRADIDNSILKMKRQKLVHLQLFKTYDKPTNLYSLFSVYFMLKQDYNSYINQLHTSCYRNVYMSGTITRNIWRGQKMMSAGSIVKFRSSSSSKTKTLPKYLVSTENNIEVVVNEINMRLDPIGRFKRLSQQRIISLSGYLIALSIVVLLVYSANLSYTGASVSPLVAIIILATLSTILSIVESQQVKRNVKLLLLLNSPLLLLVSIFPRRPAIVSRFSKSI